MAEDLHGDLFILHGRWITNKIRKRIKIVSLHRKIRVDYFYVNIIAGILQCRILFEVKIWYNEWISTGGNRINGITVMERNAHPYELAVDELVLKFRHIIREYRNVGRYSPIEQVDGRVKSNFKYLRIRCRERRLMSMMWRRN